MEEGLPLLRVNRMGGLNAPTILCEEPLPSPSHREDEHEDRRPRRLRDNRLRVRVSNSSAQTVFEKEEITAIGVTMSESYLWSKEFQEGMKKVGPGSKFWYRSRFDPLTQDEYEMICELEDRKFQNES